VTVSGGATIRVSSVPLYRAISAWTCSGVVGSPSERCSAIVVPKAAEPSHRLGERGLPGGLEDYHRYGAVLSRLIPGPLATRYYTRWLRQVSTYLDTATDPGPI
jgi:hypothetical protein